MKDCVLQGGIYTVGEFQKAESKTKIALHKNKSTNILVAELTRGISSTPSSPPSSPLPLLGEVTYKYVVDTSPLSLKIPEQVSEFSNRLVTTLNSLSS